MTEPTPAAEIPEAAEPQGPSLDTLLRDAVPEIKLALGDLIDRENSRALPDRYARLLPENMLAVVLRPDAADVLLPVAAELEHELSDSCTRHGSLYDRGYRVKLRRADNPGAPLFRVTVLSAAQAAQQQDAAPPQAPPAPSEIRVESVAGNATQAAPAAPALDEDATRYDLPAAPAGPPPGAYELVAEEVDGREIGRYPITGARTTVGRRTEKAELRSDITLPEVPHLSRRQLVLAWEGEGDAPFRLYNVGLNPVHVEEREIPGANAGKGPLRLEAIAPEHAAQLPIDTPVRVGEHGPVLRIRRASNAPPADPDATRFG